MTRKLPPCYQEYVPQDVFKSMLPKIAAKLLNFITTKLQWSMPGQKCRGSQNLAYWKRTLTIELGQDFHVFRRSKIIS